MDECVRVLIVEDEFLIATDVEDVVLAMGHQVIGPVGTMAHAKEVAAEADIAIVDVRLADGLTGPELADHLKAEHGVTVIFATGNPEAVALSQSALGYLCKPYWPAEVSEAIGYAIGVREGGAPRTPEGFTLLPVA